MATLKTYISALLLLTFAFVLVEESHGDLSEAHIFTCEVVSSSNSILDCDTPEKAEPTKCSDPCHAGQAHFGHGHFLEGSAKLNILIVGPVIVDSAFSHDIFESPFLDGPRRPPRQS